MHLRTSTTKTVCQGYSSETTVQNFYAGTCGHLGIKLTVSLCNSSENFFFKLLQIRVGQSWWYQKTWKKWPYAVFIHPWTCAYKLLICMPIFSQSWQNLVCSTCISVAEENIKFMLWAITPPHPYPKAIYIWGKNGKNWCMKGLLVTNSDGDLCICRTLNDFFYDTKVEPLSS